jgi:hypothetical protein
MEVLSAPRMRDGEDEARPKRHNGRKFEPEAKLEVEVDARRGNLPA